jgi:hypothetical protein
MQAGVAEVTTFPLVVVPEPTTLTLLLLMTSGLAIRSRRS